MNNDKITMHLSSIQAFKITKTFNDSLKKINVLNDLSYNFGKDATYAITGISGSGKSTFLSILSGLESPDHGQVLYDNQNIFGLSDKQKNKILSQDIGLVFQFPYLIPELTVFENIIIKSLISGQEGREIDTKVDEYLEIFGISDKKNSLPKSLSGGQQQRVALARALISQPSFLIADEPTAHLDRQNAAQIIDLLLDCKKRWHMGIILSSHDPEIVERMDHIIELVNGNLNIIR